jgi:hypothetical protein
MVSHDQNNRLAGIAIRTAPPWFLRYCNGCGVELFRPSPTYLCGDCSAEQYERLAQRVSPTYDRTKEQDWKTCTKALATLYGKNWEYLQASKLPGW